MTTAFSTTRNAFFAAARTELLAALPGWRVPLAKATERVGKNPFTGKPLTYGATRDPAPGAVAVTPATLPFEHVLLPDEEDWESEYLALEMALSGQYEPIPAWNDVGIIDVMERRGLYEVALFGGGADHSVYVVPSRIVQKLGMLIDAAARDVLNDWNRNVRSGKTITELGSLRGLARAASTTGREMFLWLNAPASR